MKLKKIRPMFTSIVTTMDKYIDTDAMVGGIIDTSKMKTGIREYQKVVAVGDSVRGVKVGDIVCINPSNYAIHNFSPNSVKNDLMTNEVTRYSFNVVELDGVNHLILQERDIDFVVEEYED